MPVAGDMNGFHPGGDVASEEQQEDKATDALPEEACMAKAFRSLNN